MRKLLFLAVLAMSMLQACQWSEDRPKDPPPSDEDDQSIENAIPGFSSIDMSIKALRQLALVDGAEGLRIYNVMTESASAISGATGDAYVTLMAVAIDADSKEIHPDSRPYLLMERGGLVSALDRESAQAACRRLKAASLFSFCADFMLSEVGPFLDMGDCNMVSVELTRVTVDLPGSSPREAHSMLMKIHRLPEAMTEECPMRGDTEGIVSNYPCPLVCGHSDHYLHLEE